MKICRLPLAAVAFLASLGGFNIASATVTGPGQFGICLGGGVIVTATTIDWVNPVGGGNGCIATGVGTNITYTAGGGGTVGAGVTGFITDLPGPNPFIVLTGTPIQYSLSGLFLTSAPSKANCSLVTVAGDSCVAFPGSPFLLQLNVNGQTDISLGMAGTVFDGAGIVANWSGSFNTQLPKLPSAIANNINAGGSELSAYSGTLTATIVPEPATFALIGFGLIAVAYRRRKA